MLESGLPPREEVGLFFLAEDWFRSCSLAYCYWAVDLNLAGVSV